MKFTFLGLYFLLEMFTITDVMGLTNLEWGPWLVRQGNLFWFYGLACSLLLGIWEIWFGEEVEEAKTGAGEKDGVKKGSAEKEVVEKRAERDLPYKQIMIDGCDLLIPGAAVGWLPYSPLTISVAMSISTVLSMSDMWAKYRPRMWLLVLRRINKCLLTT